ncbi:MAG: serine/threonine protein kinase [Solirubrobacteraceae bacterium]|nr:serine/threonine protein kinase [Solirubrobacteraceae bacterium]
MVPEPATPIRSTARPAPSGPSPSAASAVPGDLVLGRYRLRRVLGRGGAGTVWQATDEQLGRDVAIKSLPLERGGRAVDEARAAARLAHPAIVAVYALGRTSSAAWIVTEFVPGDTLRRTIVDDTHSDVELLEIGVALAAGLQHAHDRGIVHRDVTPRNVLIPAGAFDDDDRRPCRDGISPAKLADFGIARHAGPARDGEGADGRIVGTLSYMAPERLEGGVGDAASDVWALAVVLHEALVGEHPAGGGGEAPKASALVREHRDLPSLAGRRPDLDPALVAAIDRACSADPAARGDAADLGRALREELERRDVRVASAVDPMPRTAADRPEGAGRRSAVPPAAVPPAAAAAGALLGPWVAVAAAIVVALAVLAASGASDARRRTCGVVAALAGVAALCGIVGPVLAGGAGVAAAVVCGGLAAVPPLLAAAGRAGAVADRRRLADVVVGAVERGVVPRTRRRSA